MISIRNALMSIPVIFGIGSAKATDFTADKVLTGMNTDERAAYLAGVVEGLAYARYKKDGDQKTGMECIYDWFFTKDETPQAILAAFKRFPDHTPGAVMAAMIQKECGA